MKPRYQSGDIVTIKDVTLFKEDVMFRVGFYNTATCEYSLIPIGEHRNNRIKIVAYCYQLQLRSDACGNVYCDQGKKVGKVNTFKNLISEMKKLVKKANKENQDGQGQATNRDTQQSSQDDGADR